MPARQEAPVSGGADRLHLGPQRRQRTAPQDAQDVGVAPLLGSGAAGRLPTGDEVAAHQPAVTGQSGQHVGRNPQSQPEAGGGIGRGERGASAGVTAQQLAQRVGHLLGEGGRHAYRNRDPDPVAQPPDVLDGHPPAAPGKRHGQRPPGRA